MKGIAGMNTMKMMTGGGITVTFDVKIGSFISIFLHQIMYLFND